MELLIAIDTNLFRDCLGSRSINSMTSPEEHGLTHIDAAGNARMVDVADREITVREASARAQVLVSEQVVEVLRDGTAPKGDVLGTARIAGIMAAKKTSELIPLCHPIATTSVKVDLVVTDCVEITAVVKTVDRTGVEMEALTAASVAGLTVIDMIKALDPAATITNVQMTAKSGGRNGEWHRN
jgi:cyclic pyranopterin phosphate synthase